MKKITKLGLSALCGSLAAISVANAGSVDVVGSAHMTWTSLGNSDTGNPFGMKSNMSFIGEGELDGGQGVKMSIVHTDKATWSAADIALTTNNVGVITLSAANGGGLGSYDDISPTAWEETWDTGVGTNINLQKGVGSSTHISWTSPAVSAGTKLIIAYTPQNDGVSVGDKAASGASANTLEEGIDIVLDIAPDGPLNVFLGYSQTFQPKGVWSQRKAGDHEEAVIGTKLSIGPFAIGGQVMGENTGDGIPGNARYYLNTSWGVALNVNDGLSLSYGETMSNKIFNEEEAIISSSASGSDHKWIRKHKQRGRSWQAGYTVGGVTLKYADSVFDNVGYVDQAAKDSQIISMGIAF